MPKHVLPAGESSDYAAADEFYFSSHCRPLSEVHVLPTLKNPTSTKDHCAIIARTVKPCAILRDFTETNGFLKTCFEQSVTSYLHQLTRKSTIDALVVTKEGIILLFHIPKGKSMTQFLTSSREQDITTLCCFISDCFSSEVPFTLCFLAQPQNTHLGHVHDSPSWRTTSVDELSTFVLRMKQNEGSPTFEYEAACKTLVSFWRHTLTTPPILPNADSSLTNEAQREQASNIYLGSNVRTIKSFIEFCAGFTTDHLPLWRNVEKGKVYMVPPVFRFRSKEAFSSRKDFIGASGATPAPSKKECIVRGDEAEFAVFQNIESGARQNSQHFVAVHGLKVCRSNSVVRNFNLLPGNVSDLEIDFVCLSPVFGVALIEVKAADSSTKAETLLHILQSSESQMSVAEDFLKTAAHELNLPWFHQVLTKLIVSPFMDKEYLKEAAGGKLIKIARRGIQVKCQLNSSWLLKTESNMTASWVHPMTAVKVKHAKSIYRNLTPILVALRRYPLNECTPYDTLFNEATNLSNFEVVDPRRGKLLTNLLKPGRRQDVVREKKKIPCSMILGNNEGATGSGAQRSTEAFLATDQLESEKNQMNVYFLTPELMGAWNGPPYQVIRGVAGTGKTILLLDSSISQVASFVLCGLRFIFPSTYELFRKVGVISAFDCPSIPGTLHRSFINDLQLGQNHVPFVGSPINFLFDDRVAHPVPVLVTNAGTRHLDMFIQCVLRELTPYISSVWISYDPELCEYDTDFYPAHVHRQQKTFLGHSFAGMVPREYRVQEAYFWKTVDVMAHTVEQELHELLPSVSNILQLRQAAILVQIPIRDSDGGLGQSKIDSVPFMHHILRNFNKSLQKKGIRTGSAAEQIEAAVLNRDLAQLRLA